MLTAIKNVKDKTRAILEQYPQARDNDALLYLLFLKEYGGLENSIGVGPYTTLKNLMLELPPPESLRRVRQKIQEGGELTGTRRCHRSELAEEVRHNIKDLGVSTPGRRSFWTMGSSK